MAETTVTPTPTTRATMTVRGSKTRGPEGRVMPNALEQGLEAERGQHPEAQADQRGHQPEDRGLDEHRPEHLPSAGADDAQEGQLPGPLARR